MRFTSRSPVSYGNYKRVQVADKLMIFHSQLAELRTHLCYQ